MRISRSVTLAVVIVFLMGGMFGSVAIGKRPQPRYEDTGCIFIREDHGCIDSGSSSICWQDASYERWGLPGQIPLPLSVTVKAHCKYVHTWVQQCSDEDTESAYGSVFAEAECYIFQVLSGDCFDDWCTEECDEG